MKWKIQKILFENLKEGNNVEELEVDGRMNLN
jgi:hypothetical protein